MKHGGNMSLTHLLNALSASILRMSLVVLLRSLELSIKINNHCYPLVAVIIFMAEAEGHHHSPYWTLGCLQLGHHQLMVFVAVYAPDFIANS